MDETIVPFAHVGHWLWALYLPPILIVIGSIVKTTISERRRARRDDGASSATRGDSTDELR
jgi:hypothetical protein